MRKKSLAVPGPTPCLIPPGRKALLQLPRHPNLLRIAVCHRQTLDRAVLRQYVDRAPVGKQRHDEVSKALSSSSGNRERIRASFQAYFDFVDEHAEGFRLLMQETVGNEGDSRTHVAEVRDQILKEVADLIVRESRGNLDRDHAEIVALALIGMVETVAQREPGGPPERRHEAVDVLVRLAWRGVTQLTI